MPPASGPAEAEVDGREEEEGKKEGPRRAATVLEERFIAIGKLLPLVLTFPLGLGPTIEQRDAEEMQARIEGVVVSIAQKRTEAREREFRE